MPDTLKKPPYLWALLTNRCPRCREGKIFTHSNPYNLSHSTKMHEKCPVCGQPTEIEVGFYYGTSYVSYALTVAFSVVSFIGWWVLLGFSLYDNRIFWWLGINAFLLIVLQPVFMRLSRVMWLSWFVNYDPHWKERQAEEYERIVKEQMNNW